MESEIKNIIPNHKLYSAVDFVSKICTPDPEHSEARVASIYYDSKDYHSLYEKINSDYYKSKFRLRWYRNCLSGKLSDTAFMEVKYRVGASRIKKRVPAGINPELLDKMDLQDSRLLALPNLLGLEGVMSQWHLFPVLLIEYNRRRYIEPKSGCRVSIDSDICVSRFNQQMMPGGQLSTLQNSVIEAKGLLSELPKTLNPLMNLGVRKASFSKYLSCYAKSHQVIFDPR